MPSKIILKKSSVAAKAPVAGDLDFGELAINYTDSKLYFKKADGSIDAFSSAAASAPVTSVGGNIGAITDAQLLASIKNVDGTGSGLDADFLDGNSAAAFYLASNPSGYTSNTGTVTSVGATSPIVSSGGTTPSLSIAAANSTTNGYMTSAYASKLDGIAAGAQVNVATNLAQGPRTTTAVPITSSTGTTAILDIATTSLAGVMSSADKTKLDGIATGATANTGTVTGVTATAPVASSGGTAPVISMAAASSGVNGYMTGAYATKLDGIATGATNVTNTNQLTNGAGYITSSGSISGNAATATNSSQLNGITKVLLWNNSGNGHSTYQSFSAIPDFGVWFMQNSAAGDTPQSGSQFYIQTQGLGSDYAYGSYALMTAVARDHALKYTYYRTREGGTWNAWSKGAAGYADSAGSITSQANSATITASTAATANQIVLRDTNGDDYRRYGFANYFNMDHGVSGTTTDTIFYSSGDNYIRKNNATGFRASLNVPTRTGGDASGTWGINVTGSAGSVAWTSVSGRPTAVSSFTNDSAYITTAGARSALSFTAGSGAYNSTTGVITIPTNTNQLTNGAGFITGITINYNNDSNSTYQMLWGSGNAIYGTAGIYCNPSIDYMYAAAFSATSDETLKTNWRNFSSNFIEELSKVKSGTYDRVDVELTQDGVSAQSLQTILPNSVTEGKDGKLSVNYGNAALVSSIELAKRVVEQDKRIAELEKLVSKLIGN